PILMVDHNTGYQIGGMSRIGRTIGVDHTVAIAVISNYDGSIAVFQSRSDNRLCTSVHSLASLYCCLKHTCMTHHICISKVKADKIHLLFMKLDIDLLRYFIGTHLWL